MKPLYIIGNGFDLYHGIPSTYKHFGDFVKLHNSALHELIDKYFGGKDQFWSDFEAGLADFDAETLLEEASDQLVSYGAEDWSDSYHHNYQFEIEEVVAPLSKDLKTQFTTWIQQLPIQRSGTSSTLLHLDKSATYLSFNYTPTLTTLYGIPPNQIVHIHGTAAKGDLIVGHGWDRQLTIPKVDDEEVAEQMAAEDPRILQGNEIIAGYFQATFKPTRDVIKKHESFFRTLGDIGQILIMGHSLAAVDLPYFAEIIRHIDTSTVRWKVSYHGNPHGIREKFSHLTGIPNHLVEFAQLSDF